MSWYNAIFVNWFGLKLMIPFVLLFLNVWVGMIGLMVWAGSYIYAINKSPVRNPDIKRNGGEE